MASFIWFVPGAKLLKDIDFATMGAGDDKGKASCGVNKGPNGGPGLCITAPSAALKEKKETLCGYYPDKQEWRECAGGMFWIGIEKDNPPGPEDLQRPSLIDGYFLTAHDDRQWLIPTARCWPAGTRLPQNKQLDSDGNLQCEIMEVHRELWDIAEKVWDRFYTAADASEDEERVEKELVFDDREEWDICVKALAANYRLDCWQVSALALLNDASISQILMFLIDLPAYTRELLAKKKIADDSQCAD